MTAPQTIVTNAARTASETSTAIPPPAEGLRFAGRGSPACLRYVEARRRSLW